MEFKFDLGFEEFKKIKEHKLYPYARCVGYTALMYLVYTFLLYCMKLFVVQFYSGLFLYFLQAMLAIFFLNAIILTFFGFEKAERDAYLEAFSDPDFSAKRERRKALKSRLFWLRMLVLWGLVWIVPIIGLTNEGLLYFVYELLDQPLPSAFLTKLIGVAVFVPVSFIWSIFAWADVRKMWLEMPRRLSRKQVYDSTEKKLKNRYRIGNMILRILGSAVLYTAGAVVLPALFGVIAVAVAAAIMLSGFKWVWFLLGFFVVLTYYLCIRTRFRFLFRLRRCCKKNGFRVIAKKHSYRSLIRDKGGYNLAVSANGKTYYCRILASVRKSNKIYLTSEGICERARIVHMPTIRAVRVGGFVQMNSQDMDEGREMFRVVSSFDYRFEADGEKIILFNPVPKFLFKKDEYGSRPLDNGEKVGEYKVYSGNAFLRSLERDCT